MSSFSAEDLLLNVSESKFVNTVTVLQGYVSELQDIVSEYETKKNEIEGFYSGKDTDTAKAAVEENIKTVNNTINYANEQIKSIQELLANKATTESQVSDALGNALELARNVTGL